MPLLPPVTTTDLAAIEVNIQILHQIVSITLLTVRINGPAAVAGGRGEATRRRVLLIEPGRE